MRISKTQVVFCAIALCAALVGSAAADTEAQAKAREALRKKLAEEGQTTPETPVAPVAPVPPARRVAPTPGQQDKLREALRQKIQELNQQEPAGVTATPAVVTPAPVETPAPAVTPAPVAAPAPIVVTPAPVTPVPTASPATTPEQEDKLREALRQKIQELNQQEAVVISAPAAVTPAPVAPPAPVATPAPIVVTPAPAAPVTPAPAVSPVVPSGNEEQLRQAMRRKIQELNEPGVAETTQTPAASPQTSKTSDEQAELMRQRLREKIAEEQAREQAAQLAAPVQPVTVQKPPAGASPQFEGSGFAPIAAPPSGLPGSKEARLAELTRRYKADQITPEEYHKERAKLIAEP